MRPDTSRPTHINRLRSSALGTAFGVALTSSVLLAQGVSPWERAAANLEATFTGPLARSLALVAIVIGGLMFVVGEGGATLPIRPRRASSRLADDDRTAVSHSHYENAR